VENHQTELVKHVPQEQLRLMVRKEKDIHIRERLLFINHIYLGDSVQDACMRMCISEQTGYNWLKQWNEKGYEGLIPDFGGGRQPKLTDEQKEQLKEKLKSQDNWLTSQAMATIREVFGVTYSIGHVARLLRGFGMHYAKPYPHDYRQPENAKELLMQSIEKADINQDCIVGFLDEARPQTTDNRQRFWSFGKPRMPRNTTKYRANTFGFYPVNGKEVVEFMQRSTVPYVCEFLRMVRDRNPGRRIVMFLDNFMSHKANATRRFAEMLDIELVFIPVYSPQLNPIELIWKSVRRRVSQIMAKTEWSFRESIRTSFHRLAKRDSFMRGWLDVFMPEV
jgi:transposase